MNQSLNIVKNLIYVLLILFFTSKCQENHVVGSTGYGFFSEFIGVLNHIDFSERNNKNIIAYWDSKFLYYEKNGLNGIFNAWEYYFEPVTNNNIVKPSDKIIRNYFCPDRSALWPKFWLPITHDMALRANALIRKYIKIKPHVTKIAETFYEKNMNGCFIIGIHWRGTDKGREIIPIKQSSILQKAQEFANTLQQPFKYLVASDEWSFIRLAQKTLMGGPVIFYEAAERSSSNYAFFLHKESTTNPSKRGLDVLIEVLLLSKSNILIHTLSNVSTSALFFNPDLIDIILFIPGKPLM